VRAFSLSAAEGREPRYIDLLLYHITGTDGAQMNNSIGLTDVIAWVESKGDPYAFRFEPATYANLANPSAVQKGIIATIQTIHNCSYESAKVIYSSSFGKYQIMGFNLFAPKLSLCESAFKFMGDSATQDAMFTKLIASMALSSLTPDTLASSLWNRQHFGAIYNGNAQAYGISIAQALVHFGYNVAG
jgi:hypothetical protein